MSMSGVTRSRIRRLLAALAGVASIVASSLLTATPAAASFAAPLWERQIGFKGSAFVNPWGMATAKDGTILASDYTNYNIKRFSISGAYLGSFGGTHAACPNNQPAGLAVDRRDGSIYLADTQNFQYIKYDSSGNCLFTVKVGAPDYVARYMNLAYLTVNSHGNVYLDSAHNTSSPGQPVWPNKVFVYDPNGNFLFDFGTDGIGVGQFNLIRGLDTDANDNLYINDVGNHVVQVFDPNGNFITQFPNSGTAKGLTSTDTRGLTIDKANGWIYLTDATNEDYEKFTLSGQWLGVFGGFGANPGQFGGIRQATVGPDGNFYAADYALWRIEAFDPDGNFLQQIPNPPQGPPNGGLNQNDGVAVDPANGWVYTTDTFNNRIEKFDLNGNFLATWGYRFDTLLAPQSVDYPRGVAVDPNNGNVWISNTRAGNVKGYDSNGNQIAAFGSQGSLNYQYKYNNGIAVGSNGLVYVGDMGNLRLKVTTQTGSVVEILPCGTVPIPFPPTLTWGCIAVAIDSAGNSYWASANQGEILKYDPNWNLVGTIGGGTGAGPGQLNVPSGIAIYGNLMYVTEANNNRISVFDMSGNFVGSWGSAGPAHGQFNNPRGVAVDASGKVYIADTGNSRIEVFAAVPQP
jgi:DNA-binding beta-propeller fold protein YncE